MPGSNEPEIDVLLVQDDLFTASIAGLTVSEIKECRLRTFNTASEAFRAISPHHHSLILIHHSAEGEDTPGLLAAAQNAHPAIYVIACLPDETYADEYRRAGAVDCVIKQGDYVPNLVLAIKRGLVRIAERSSFVLRPMTLARQFTIDEYLPDVVFILDSNGQFLHVNKAILKMLGYEQSEVAGRNFVSFVEEEHAPIFESYLKELPEKKNFRGILKMRTRAGQTEVFEINCAYLKDSSVYGVLRVASGGEEMPESPAEKRAEETAPARLGPYRILTLLGAGSLGRVYKGMDELLERPVAIKIINREYATDAAYTERFHKEAVRLASITHPNIALIYFFGNLDGLPFFCMEYLPDGSLEDLLVREGSVDPKTATSYTLQVALALNEAWSKGILHLDLRPSNLMLAENDRIKIVDFGFAHRQSEVSKAEQSTFYTAPELSAGERGDLRSDIFSLGRVLQRMLTHQDNAEPSATPPLLDLIKKMTEIDPGKRTSSYSVLIEELERVRRELFPEENVIEIPKPQNTSVLLSGLIYDQPFAEVLGHILKHHLSGKIVLSWFDLCKQVYVQQGKIFAVLSNQEGESFFELLMKQNQLSRKKAKQIQDTSLDLLLNYSSAVGEVSEDMQGKVKASLHALATQILQSLFSWQVGEFIFEKGDFSGPMHLQIPAAEVLITGIKETMDLSMIRRRLLLQDFSIRKNESFQARLKEFPILPSDSFLLFRFEESIPFRDLMNLSGLPEEEYLRLVYLFYCSGIITLEGAGKKQRIETQAQGARKSPPNPEIYTDPAREALNLQKASPTRPAAYPAAKQEMAAPQSKNEESELRRTPPAQRLPTEDFATYYYRCAVQSYQHRNYWATAEYCKKALENRQSPEIWHLMGNAFAKHLKFRFEALEAYKKALEMDPENAGIHRDMADLYYNTGSLALARAKYQETLKLRPFDQHCRQRLETLSRSRRG